MPTITLIDTASTKVSSRKRRSGSNGSGARRSCAMKSTPSTAHAIASSRIGADVHGYSSPPQTATRSAQVTAETSSSAPSRSTLWRVGTNGTLSDTVVTTNATIPNGMLIVNTHLQER